MSVRDNTARANTPTRRIPGTALVGIIALAAIFPILFPSPTTTSVAVFTLIYLIATSGWNIFSGYSGSISLGHTAFYGIGQYAVALIATHWNVTNTGALFALIPLGGLIAAVAAVPLGIVMLRSRSHTFIILSIALLFILQLFAFNFRSFTQGEIGVLVPQPPWLGGSFNVPFYYFGLVALVITVAFSWAVRRSRFGLELLAIRDDEDRALGLGVDTTRDKLIAWTFSGFFVGVAGGIYALFEGSVFPQFAFDPSFSIFIVVIAFAGGVGTVAGPVVGGLLFVPLQQYLQLQFGNSNGFLIGYGLVFILILRLLPGGIVPRVLAAMRARQATDAPASPGSRPTKAEAESGDLDAAAAEGQLS